MIDIRTHIIIALLELPGFLNFSRLGKNAKETTIAMSSVTAMAMKAEGQIGHGRFSASNTATSGSPAPAPPDHKTPLSILLL